MSEEFDPTSVKGLNVKAFEQWLGYKKGKKQTYKNAMSLRAVATRLSEMGDDDVQQAAVDQSVSNNWSGLFEPSAKKPKPGEKPVKSKEMVAADDRRFEHQTYENSKMWEELARDSIGKLRQIDAMLARLQFQHDDPNFLEKLSGLREMAARHLRDCDAKLAYGDPHIRAMVRELWGEAGVNRLRERATGLTVINGGKQ